MSGKTVARGFGFPGNWLRNSLVRYDDACTRPVRDMVLSDISLCLLEA
jgi:hypothetical protein